MLVDVRRRRARSAGPAAAGPPAGRPNGPHWARQVLTTRALTIGGGTTDIQLNIIGERILGLPRDPGPARRLMHWPRAPRASLRRGSRGLSDE